MIYPQHNSMFRVYEEPLTAKPRPRALSQITTYNDAPTNPGPLSTPAPPTDMLVSSSRMFIPGQFSAAVGQQPNEQLQMLQHTILQRLSESPELPALSERDDYDLPLWVMSSFSDANEAALYQQTQ